MDNKIDATMNNGPPGAMFSSAGSAAGHTAAAAVFAKATRREIKVFDDSYGVLFREAAKVSNFTDGASNEQSRGASNTTPAGTPANKANSGLMERGPGDLDTPGPLKAKNVFDRIIEATADKAKDVISTVKELKADAREKILDVLDRHTSLVNLNEASKKAGFGSMYPDAKLFTGKASLAMLAGKVAGIDMLVNSESGEVSFFGFGGLEAGLTTPGLSAGVGKVWNVEENQDYEGWSVDATAGWNVGSVTAFASQPDDVPLTGFDFEKGLQSPHGFTVNPIDIGLQDVPALPNLSASKTYAVQAQLNIPLVGYLMDPVGTFFNWLD